ncbi:MAG: formylglycine-generating enzyme family protein [Deltaproteobacteria bacterium]|nr:formylglycine-generating enzyme family protein [Deltaproteobacteria bacterium]
MRLSRFSRWASLGLLFLLAGCRMEDFAPPSVPAPEEGVKPSKQIRVDGWWTWMGCETPGDPRCEADEIPGRMTWVDGYRIDETEVTVEQYAACVVAGACKADSVKLSRPKGKGPPRPSEYCNWKESGREKHPMNCVTWIEARHYCRWLGGRLPSEKEWERAARGLSFRRYPWGDAEPGAQDEPMANLADANFAKQEVNLEVIADYLDGHVATAAVGSYPAGRSAVGALDMAGNVWEWTKTAYLPYPGNQDLGLAAKARGETPVIRGGSWTTNAQRARCANRADCVPWARDPAMGFRCAADLHR